jgi:hypothetical protein
VIIYHQDNVGGFSGAQTFYWGLQPLFGQRATITTAAPANEEIEQSRSIMRFVFFRVFGRVN